MSRDPRWILMVTVIVSFSPAMGMQTVGLFLETEESFDGYTLFGTLAGTETYLIDNQGKLVNQWSSTLPTGNTVYLLPNGHLLRCGRYEPIPTGRFFAGGTGGRVQEFDWEGNVVWDFTYSDDLRRHHHDIAPLPNGNVLLIAWELKTQAEAIAAGRSIGLLLIGELWPEHIVEIQPDGPTGGTVVWEWHVWDHLIQDHDPTKGNFGVVADHPELVDVNFTNGRPANGDWLHANAIDYNPELDQILLSVPFWDEVWVIDHSTTPAEAAGHTGGNSGKGGDLLYRWGNPLAYRRGTDTDRTLYGQHDAEWIDAGLPGGGNLLVFNNGSGRPGGSYSSIDEWAPPVDQGGNYSLAPGAGYGPESLTWTYFADPATDLFSGNLSSSQRLPNGNTLIDEGGTGEFTEVDAFGQIVWFYVNPGSMTGGTIQQGNPATNNRVFRADRYAADYPGFIGKDLTPGDPLEGFTRPLPVPDGRNGTTALIATRLDADGNAINVTWDTSCVSGGYNLLFGDLADVASDSPTAADCFIGTTGNRDWTTVPAGDLYFLIVGADATGVYESSWGTTSSGAERNGPSASFVCGASNKITTETCP